MDRNKRKKTMEGKESTGREKKEERENKDTERKPKEQYQ